jgi:hypothetical protein
MLMLRVDQLFAKPAEALWLYAKEGGYLMVRNALFLSADSG